MATKKKTKEPDIAAQIEDLEARVSRLERGQLPSKEELNARKKEKEGDDNS